MASRLTINRFETEIDSPYITKSLHPDTLSKILSENDETVYRLYQITGDKKEIKYFAEIKGDDLGYSFSACVKTSYAFAGDAREQIESIGNHQDRWHNPLTTREETTTLTEKWTSAHQKERGIQV